MLDTTSFLVVDNISKQYGNTKALQNLSFRANVGEVVALLGPNGAGKSTTMRLLAGFHTPDAGQVLLQGKSVASQRHLLGYLPENGGIYPELTVKEYLTFMCRAYGIYDKHERLRAIDQAATLTHCDGYLYRPMEVLSKGMKQRVFLASVLLHNPLLLILDEPTEGLDPNQKYEIQMLLHSLKKDRLIFFSTHLLTEVEPLCDRVLLLNHGKCVLNATPAEFVAVGDGDIYTAFRKLTLPEGKQNEVQELPLTEQTGVLIPASDNERF